MVSDHRSMGICCPLCGELRMYKEGGDTSTPETPGRRVGAGGKGVGKGGGRANS